MKFILSLSLLLFAQIVMSQITIEKDTLIVFETKQKFEFERWKNTTKKKLKAGKGIEVVLKEGDSSHTIYGFLSDANERSLRIVPQWEIISFDTCDFLSSSTTYYFENSLATIPVNNIKSLEYDANYPLIPYSLGYLSLITATVVAPLVSIDKNSPNKFNSQRYKSIVFPSLIGAGIGFTIGYSLSGGKNRFKLKPTSLNKYP